MSRTHTVGLLVDADHSAALASLRRRLGAPESTRSSATHVSLTVLLDVPDPAALDRRLAEVAGGHAEVVTAARGFGVFDDDRDGLVLYLPVVRNPALDALHAAVIDAARDVGAVVEGHHQRDRWIPHVTIWDRTMVPSALVRSLTVAGAHRLPAWTLTLDRLARLSDGVAFERRLPRGRAP